MVDEREEGSRDAGLLSIHRHQLLFLDGMNNKMETRGLVTSFFFVNLSKVVITTATHSLTHAVGLEIKEKDNIKQNGSGGDSI